MVLTLVSIWYGQNHHLLPLAASEEATRVDDLFNVMMTIATGLFLLVQSILIISLFRFRRQPGDETDGPPVHGNIPLEILWTAIPAVIVLGIAIYSFEVYNAEGGFNPMDHSVAHGSAHQKMAKMPGAAIAATLAQTPSQTVDPNQQQAEQVLQDPNTADIREDVPQRRDAPTLGTVSPRIGPSPDKAGRPPQMAINVTGLQFAWIFTYPESGVVSGELHVPANRDVLLNISANDVIHAFWVPQFRLKQDAVPGRQTELRFTPTQVGEYPVICAELCGAYHGAMKTRVLVQTPEDFNAWIQSQKVAANPAGLEGAIALQPANLPDDQFLAPYAQEMGVTSDAIRQISHLGMAGDR